MKTTNMNSENISTGSQLPGVRNATQRALELRLAAQIAEGDPQLYTTALTYTEHVGPLPPSLSDALMAFCFLGFKKRALELVAKAREDNAPAVQRVESVYGANWDASDKLESRLRMGFNEFFDPLHRWREESWREYATGRFAHNWLERLLSLYDSCPEAKGRPAEVLQFVADVWDGGTGTASLPIHF